MDPKFIVLEGMDGCSKSTQVKLLGNLFKRNDIKVHLTREPTSSFNEFKKIITNDSSDANYFNALCIADRINHCYNGIDSIQYHMNINRENVICDRYFISTLVYSNYNYLSDKELPKHAWDAMNQEETFIRRCVSLYTGMKVLGFIKPDYIFILDTNVEEALQRIESRDEDISKYENLKSLTNIRKAYKLMYYYFKDVKYENIKFINSSQDPADVLKDILNTDIFRGMDLKRNLYEEI